jgi:hypothetical protein
LDPAQISTDFPDADFLGVGMKSLIGEDEVCSHQTRIPAKNDGTFDPTVERSLIFTGVFYGRFPWTRYGIATW